MTIREWLARRTPSPPPSLSRQMLALLGSNADADAARTSDVCLAAAARGLESLVSDGRFARDSALELLAIDALTTYAFEHAATRPDSGEGLAALVERGARMLGQLTAQRV